MAIRAVGGEPGRVSRADAAARLQNQRDPHRPTVGADQGLAQLAFVGHRAEARQGQRDRIRFAELQILRAELTELAVRAPARQRQIGLDARAKHQRDVIRQALDQRLGQFGDARPASRCRSSKTNTMRRAGEVHSALTSAASAARL